MTATIDDIASATGYHRTTVSKVLAGDKRCYASAATRAIIQDAARRLNFVPNYFARSLQARRSMTVGVVARLDSISVTGGMLKAIVDGLRAQGYMALFSDCSSGPDATRAILSRMRERRVDGLILDIDNDDETVAALLPPQAPVVAIRSATTSRFPCVIADRRQAFEQAVQWLADRGHRRIGFMGMDNRLALLSPQNTHSLKLAGYQAAMRRLGFHDDAWLLDADSAPGAVRAYVAAHGPLFRTLTAVLACNDRAAIEVMTGLAELGLRVPEDCAVIGFDDTEFATSIRPRLTTLRPRRAEVGARAVEMILALIDGRSVENQVVVPELVERESAGPCRSVADDAADRTTGWRPGSRGRVPWQGTGAGYRPGVPPSSSE